MRVLLIGNGTSRKDFDINLFVDRYSISKTIGCNAIWRDYIPNYIVIWDDKPLFEYINYRKSYDWYSRLVFPDSIEKDECTNEIGQNSGAYAMKWAIRNFDPEEVFLLGFDYFQDSHNRGSQMYSYEGESLFTCSKNVSVLRAKGMASYMKKYNEIKFHILTPRGAELDECVYDIPNISKLSLDQFKMKETAI